MRLELIDPRGLWAVYEDGKTGDDWTFATWEGKARAEEWMKSRRIADLERQLVEAQVTIAALQWTKITPDNLPKVGDEVGKWTPSGYFHTAQLSSEWRIEAQLEDNGWTYRRSLSPPAQASAAERCLDWGITYLTPSEAK